MSHQVSYLVKIFSLAVLVTPFFANGFDSKSACPLPGEPVLSKQAADVISTTGGEIVKSDPNTMAIKDISCDRAQQLLDNSFHSSEQDLKLTANTAKRITLIGKSFDKGVGFNYAMSTDGKGQQVIYRWPIAPVASACNCNLTQDNGGANKSCGLEDIYTKDRLGLVDKINVDVGSEDSRVEDRLMDCPKSHHYGLSFADTQKAQVSSVPNPEDQAKDKELRGTIFAMGVPVSPVDKFRRIGMVNGKFISWSVNCNPDGTGQP